MLMMAYTATLCGVNVDGHMEYNHAAQMRTSQRAYKHTDVATVGHTWMHVSDVYRDSRDDSQAHLGVP